jgi:signal transduction histidine kinase
MNHGAISAAALTRTIKVLLTTTLAGWCGLLFVDDQSTVVVLDNLYWTTGYAAGALLAWRGYLGESGETQICRWSAIGLATLTAAQLIWAYQVATQWTPFPGPSDPFFLSTGPAIAIGLWHIAKQRLDPSAQKAVLLDTATLLVGVLTASLVLFLPRQGHYTFMQLLVMAGYPLGLALPTCLGIILILALRARFDWRALALPLGTLLLAVLWVEWNLRFLAGHLLDGDWVNVGFAAVAIFLGFGAANYRLAVISDEHLDRRYEAILRMLPLAMVITAAAGFTLVHSNGGMKEDIELVAALGGSTAVVLAVMRQSYLLRDRERLLAAESLVSQRERELEEINRELEQRVEMRTTELVKSQKLAALGSLVTGVAHELNTPLGNALVVSSTMAAQLEDIRQQIESGSIRRSSLDDFMRRAEDANSMIDRNLRRAAELVSNFKQIAVDRSASGKRKFDLGNALRGIAEMNRMGLRDRPYRITVETPDNLYLDSYPGPLGQLLDILIDNAVRHGFDGRDSGEIRLSVAPHGDASVELLVIDDGHGIRAVDLDQIFDPFFTTRLGHGGSGLGLHVGWNIAEGVLGGRIEVTSTRGRGTTCRIVMPRVAPGTAEQSSLSGT